MKIVGKLSKERTMISMRIKRKLLDRIDTVAEKSNLARQKLIEMILQKALDDPKFILRVDADL